MRDTRLTTLALLLGVFATGAGAQAPPPAPATTVLRAARLLDVKTGTMTNDAFVIVEGSMIKSVGSGFTTAPGAKVIDLGNVTLLPGLIDTHTHLLQNYNGRMGGDDENMLNTVATMSPAARALLGAKMAREDLEAGITAVRDLGNSGWNGDVALRDAINRGYVVGPRMQVSTRALSAAGGQFGALQPAAQALIEQEYAVVSTPEEARRAVRQAFYDGADLIKVIVNTGPRVVSLEEMKAIVEEAKRVGKRVAAHAIGDTATRVAAEAGVNSIEHAYTVPDVVLKMMADKGIFLVATDSPAEYYVDAGNEPNLPPEKRAEQIKRASVFVKSSAERLTRATGVHARSGEPDDVAGVSGCRDVAGRCDSYGDDQCCRVDGGWSAHRIARSRQIGGHHRG
jgi:imidazolonepropionase-like amidohydrolase